MSDQSPGFESELRISAKWVFGSLMLVGAVVAFAAYPVASPSVQLQAMGVGIAILAASAFLWWLDERWSRLSSWLTVAAFVLLIYLGAGRLNLPGFLTLWIIPIGLAVVLIEFPAATAVAAGETALLLLAPRSATFDATAAVDLIAIWATVGVIYATYRPVQQVSRWSWDYFQRAQRLLEAERDRKAELAQTFESLAHANRQLALAHERTTALRSIAEEAQRAKTAFVASVSHEFRTPLNMIIGLVDLMVETPEIYDVAISPKMRQDLEVVHRNSEHLSNMVNDVLDLTRLEAGRLALHRERVDLREIVGSSVETVRPLVEKKQLGLHVEIPDDLPSVYCDRTRIKQVILNLVSNAARFTDQGTITVQVTEQDQHIHVGVADTGPGISAEDAATIFEPFCQGAGDLWRDKGGSGLGLSVSKQFVQLHGGRLWFESKPGAGTTFFFTLPISPPIEHIARPGHMIREDWVWRERVSRAARAGSTDQLARPRVVICDETGALYPEFARYSDGVELVDARDWTQATQDLQECPAHAIILNAPTTEALWPLVETAKEEAPETPILGCSVPRRIERAIDAGALGYLIKPVARADLEKAIRAVGKPVRRVLVVDDDPDVLQLFGRMLHVYDHTLQVVTAADGEQALDRLRRASYDLMLLDVMMPDMNGWQVLESATRQEGIGAVPTFFVSAQDPVDQPLVSEYLLTTMEGGLSPSRLLHCSLELSELLLAPDGGPDRVPV
jgi:signal transduction histidine kinase/CheY-like chemotaxis protein